MCMAVALSVGGTAVVALTSESKRRIARTLNTASAAAVGLCALLTGVAPSFAQSPSTPPAPTCAADAAYTIARQVIDEATTATLKMIRDNDAVSNDNGAGINMSLMSCHSVPSAEVEQLWTCLSNYKVDARDVSFHLTLGKVHSSLALNANKCWSAADYNVGLLKIMEDRGGANDERVVSRLQKWQATKNFEESERATHMAAAERVLQPLADADNPDAMQALGILGINGDLSGSSVDRNVARDYLYRAGLIFVGMNQRNKALQSVSILEDHDKDDQLAMRLRDRIYAEK